jgi:TP901-1 family phage major tail protein
MTAQKGKDLLLKVDTDGAGSFTTVAGLRARSLAFNAATIDITDQESAGRWRELLQGAGVKTARISGSGIFKDAASDETLRGYFFAGTVRDFQVIVPDLGTVEGPFQIASLEYGGQHDGEVSFELGLESAGALSFTPAS